MTFFGLESHLQFVFTKLHGFFATIAVDIFFMALNQQITHTNRPPMKDNI